MSKLINKKLHPYYKTGINGWVGEEVDDNDYILCPICGEVLGMNYCDYAGEQEYDNQCPKCNQELDYSEIYDFEDTCYFEQLLEIKESRISDLEAKLAEKDKELEIVKNLKSKEIGKTLSCVIEKLTDVIGQNLDTTTILDFFQKHDQDKISFAVEQLEKVKELLFEKAIEITGTSVDGVRLYSINEIFINQIKQLKEIKNEL